MATRGRKPVPVEEKKRRGTAQRCRLPAVAVEVAQGPVQAPQELPMGAALVWEEHAPALIAAGILRPLDAVAFGQWCVMTWHLIQAWQAGEAAPASYIQQWRTLGELFGIGPAARASKQLGGGAAKAANPFARNGRRQPA